MASKGAKRSYFLTKRGLLITIRQYFCWMFFIMHTFKAPFALGVFILSCFAIQAAPKREFPKDVKSSAVAGSGPNLHDDNPQDAAQALVEMAKNYREGPLIPANLGDAVTEEPVAERREGPQKKRQRQSLTEGKAGAEGMGAGPASMNVEMASIDAAVAGPSTWGQGVVPNQSSPGAPYQTIAASIAGRKHFHKCPFSSNKVYKGKVWIDFGNQKVLQDGENKTLETWDTYEEGGSSDVQAFNVDPHDTAYAENLFKGANVGLDRLAVFLRPPWLLGELSETALDTIQEKFTKLEELVWRGDETFPISLERLCQAPDKTMNSLRRLKASFLTPSAQGFSGLPCLSSLTLTLDSLIDFSWLPDTLKYLRLHFQQPRNLYTGFGAPNLFELQITAATGKMGLRITREEKPWNQLDVYEITGSDIPMSPNLYKLSVQLPPSDETLLNLRGVPTDHQISLLRKMRGFSNLTDLTLSSHINALKYELLPYLSQLSALSLTHLSTTENLLGRLQGLDNLNFLTLTFKQNARLTLWSEEIDLPSLNELILKGAEGTLPTIVEDATIPGPQGAPLSCLKNNLEKIGQGANNPRRTFTYPVNVMLENILLRHTLSAEAHGAYVELLELPANREKGARDDAFLGWVQTYEGEILPWLEQTFEDSETYNLHFLKWGAMEVRHTKTGYDIKTGYTEKQCPACWTFRDASACFH
jgi:hypothetical protein